MSLPNSEDHDYLGSSFPRANTLEHPHTQISVPDSGSNQESASRRRYRKYRPITQSYYGVHHHKTQEPPTLSMDKDSIRNQTIAINNLGLKLDPQPEDGEVYGSLQLGRYDTRESGGAHSEYNKTVNSEAMRNQFSNLLGVGAKQGNQDGSAPNSYQSSNFGPTGALSRLFGRHSIVETDEEQGENKSLLHPVDEDNEMSFNYNTNYGGAHARYQSLPEIDPQVNPEWDHIPSVDTKSSLINTKKSENPFLKPIQYLPPVFLGLILNVLNAVSYGLIIFPTSQIALFKDFGPDGISMCLVSTFVSQFVCSGGGSIFAGGAGGFMLEVIPFLHIICQSIVNDVGPDNQHMVIPTVMVAYAMSSLVTALGFYLLGYFKLGSLVGFFPRHILVGCIGGVGFFLMQTGLETVSKTKIEYFNMESWELFFRPNSVALWGTSICLAVSLKTLQRKIDSPILMPCFYLMIPVVFFTIVNIFNLDIVHLRATGWLFELPEVSKPFYNFYTYFDFYNTSWSTLPKLTPVMMALTFFGILHVPINVPAIGVTIKQDDVDVNQELISHGWANLISGCLGSLQNYLMYSSSVLFIKSGGHSRYAGMMLAIATFCAWLIGPSMVAYIPSVVVGSLIFHLGLELFKEGVYETWGIMDPLEYTTIWLIVVVMALLGFVEGVVIGIVLACCFFVYLYSSRAPIRVAYSGAAAKSTVRRVYRHRAFLDQVRNQIQVVKLQGFLFFGTINQVEKRIRDMLDERHWTTNPIRFLILDFSLVSGVDFSGAEAFIRIRRILLGKRVHMVVCGVTSTSEVGIALHSVGIWSPNSTDDDLTRTFQTLNDGLEWCENFMLETCYRRQMQRSLPSALPQHVDDNLAANQLTAHSIATNRGSARSMLLDQAAIDTLLSEASNLPTSTLSQPLALLVQIFTESENIIDDALYQISSSFENIRVKPGEVIWHQGDEADGLYLVEQGLFKVSITTVSGASKVVESIIPGSMLGELALFTNRPRSGTVTADQEGIIWRLTKDKFHELCAQNPQLMLKFIQMALAYSAQDMNVYSVQAFELM